MSKHHGYGWLFLIGMVFCYGCLVVTADEEIKLSDTTMRPGDFIQVSVNEPLQSTVEVGFLGDLKPLQIYNNQYIGLITASYFTKPGTYMLNVKVTNNNQSYTKDYPIEVIKRNFPEDRVVIAEKTRKEILTSDNVDADAKKGTEVRQKANSGQSPPLWEGAFTWPVQGRVTTGFGLIRYMNNIEEGRHSGIDISAPTGTPVLACNQGQVVFAGTLYVTGLTVIVNHGLGLYTSYCHLSKIVVQEGAPVKQGELIGRVGMTGLATGPHLHLTIRIGEICVDPYMVLGKEIKWN
jgi:murein DD-endopeptidase MepM/ murein hydrolase activator NlpD